MYLTILKHFFIYQGPRKEKLTSTANVGPVRVESEIIRVVGGPRRPTTSREFWEYAPPGNICVLSILKCLLVHSESSSVQSLHEPLIATL